MGSTGPIVPTRSLNHFKDELDHPMLLLQIIFLYFINIVFNVLFYIFSVHCSHIYLFYLFINKGKLHKTNLQFTLSR